METVNVGLGDRAYDILIGAECIERLGPTARRTLPRADRLLLVTNPEIGRIHGAAVQASLESAGFPVETLELPEGENHKTVETAYLVWDRLIEAGFTRQSALVALGGGVVGDITGFAAATYMRGVEFIQVPTTLLAMVDSSVGGKTGVNHPLAKNIIGAFWQPRLVFMDLAMLRTLPVEEFRSGFAEVAKHGVIRDANGYFAFLENELDAIFSHDAAALGRAVRVSCEIKSAVVAEDEREGGLRAILNFGHTIGHALEALGGYGLLRHGEAVAVGMVAAARIAARMDLATGEVASRVARLLERAALPVTFPDLETDAVLERLKSDKKVRDGRVRFVLPARLGEVVIRDDVQPETIAATIEELRGHTP